MSTSSWRSRVVEALAVVLGIVVVARVVLDLLQPLLPALVALLVVGFLLLVVLRRH